MCLVAICRKAAVLRLLVASLALVALAGGCGGGEDDEDAPSTETDVSVAVDISSGDPVSGKRLFAEQGCIHCHTLAAAGSIRNVGPNLDEVAKLYPPEFVLESIVDPAAYVEKGSGGTIGGTKEYNTTMPPFGPNAPNAENLMTEEELADLVAFVVSGEGP